MTSNANRWHAERMQYLPFSAIRRMVDLANKLEGEGRTIIHFEVGAPDFPAPDHVRKATLAALEKQQAIAYAPSPGLPALRRALSRMLSEQGVQADAESGIAITIGCQEALAAVAFATLNPGDEVLASDPYYIMYPSQVAMAGARLVPVNFSRPDGGWGWDMADLRRQCSPRTKAIIINTPHNPTGAVTRRDEMEELAAFSREHDLLVIADETYCGLVYEDLHTSIASLPGMAERTLTLGTFSKTYAMMAWRVGYVSGPPSIMNAVVRTHQQMTLCASTFAQQGALAALTGDQAPAEAMRSEFDRRRRVIADELADCPRLRMAPSSGAFYYFLHFPQTKLNSLELAEWFLSEAGVAMVAGSEFGSRGEGHLRLSYATGFEACVEGARRIRAAVPHLPR